MPKTMLAELATCRASAHYASNNAWRLGCRHPEAVAAHDAWLADHSPHKQRPAAVDEHGNCIAAKHGSHVAWLAGCRCPEAEKARGAYLARHNDIDRARREREYTREYDAEIRKIKRMTGGRLRLDPRKKWQGDRQVGRLTMLFLLDGHSQDATVSELMAAVIKLTGRLVPNGPLRWRPINNMEIGDRLGIDDRHVIRLRARRRQLVSERAQRRLADAQFKAAVAAEAAGRKDRERERHEAAAKRRAEAGR